MVLRDVFTYRVQLGTMTTCFFLSFFSPVFSQNNEVVVESESLKIIKLNSRVYQHITYVQTNVYGKVACNGMLVVDDDETIVIDTPPSNQVSKELLQWITSELKSNVIAVVPTHFHSDCLGGLEFFHEQKIASYAHEKTIALAMSRAETVPKKGFKDLFELRVGNSKIMCTYFGAGHTEDNVVIYVPDGQVLFGGCLIKSLGAGKGNLEDADTSKWSSTVRNIRKTYSNPNLTVIPGHGKSGGKELLDYTIAMFEKE